MDIKPIQTEYKDYKFRSRLEARYAVFFDALGIKWEYEPEGFELSDGTRYLPDFWLPTFSGGMYVEVKPDGGDFSKADRLVLDTGKSVWLAAGVPDKRIWYVAQRDDDRMEVYHEAAVPNADQARDENRMFWQPGYEDNDGFFRGWDDALGELFLNAVKAAKQARFEHGETPQRPRNRR
jgi:hypothetical protein